MAQPSDTYRTKKGDNFFNIAQSMGWTTDELLRANVGIKAVQPNQVIKTPPKTQAPPPPTSTIWLPQQAYMTPQQYTGVAPVASQPAITTQLPDTQMRFNNQPYQTVNRPWWASPVDPTSMSPQPRYDQRRSTYRNNTNPSGFTTRNNTNPSGFTTYSQVQTTLPDTIAGQRARVLEGRTESRDLGMERSLIRTRYRQSKELQDIYVPPPGGFGGTGSDGGGGGGGGFSGWSGGGGYATQDAVSRNSYFPGFGGGGAQSLFQRMALAGLGQTSWRIR